MMSRIREPTSASRGSSTPMISRASCLSMPVQEPDEETIVRPSPAARRSSHSASTEAVAWSNRPLDCWARPQHPCVGTITS